MAPRSRRRRPSMDFAFSIGLWGVLGLIVLSGLFGILVQLVGTPSFGYEWLVTGIAAFVGAFVASEFIVDARAFEPVFDGVAIVPAVIGGILVGGVIAA